jgi:hypothetical protein
MIASRNMTVAPSLLWLTLAGLACGEDPVLKAARAEAEAAQSARAQAASGPDKAGAGAGEPPGARRGHPMDGGVAVGSSPPNGGGAVVAGEPVAGVPDEPSPAPAGSPGGGTPPDQDGQAGQAGEPRPGVPDEPLPGSPDDPSPKGRKPPPSAGPQVSLTGTVAYDGYSGGMVRVDVFDGDHLTQGAKRPSVVAMATLSRPGPFTVQVPVSAGRVWVSAFNDADRNDRPGPLDPTGYYDGNPVPTDKGAQRGLIVRLVQRAAPEDGGDDF